MIRTLLSWPNTENTFTLHIFIDVSGIRLNISTGQSVDRDDRLPRTEAGVFSKGKNVGKCMSWWVNPLSLEQTQLT